MKMVSKNIALGEPITDIRDLKRLALEKKSVVWMHGWTYSAIPAAFFLNWSLSQLLRMDLYYSIKVDNGKS